MRLLLFFFIIISSAVYSIEQPYVISKEQQCMALNIYHESRSENMAGRYAVADVVLNRVYDTRYPDNVCDVIYQGKHKPSWKDPNELVPIRNQCQFSWYCDGLSDEPTDNDAWNDSVLIAIQILENDKHRGLTEGATHYHATFVNPFWAERLQLIGHIGSHIFYRAE